MNRDALTLFNCLFTTLNFFNNCLIVAVLVSSLPGCITYGDNINHAKKMAKEAIEGYLEELKERGDEIPDDSRFLEYSLTLPKAPYMQFLNRLELTRKIFKIYFNWDPYKLQSVPNICGYLMSIKNRFLPFENALL